MHPLQIAADRSKAAARQNALLDKFNYYGQAPTGSGQTPQDNARALLRPGQAMAGPQQMSAYHQLVSALGNHGGVTAATGKEGGELFANASGSAFNQHATASNAGRNLLERNLDNDAINRKLAGNALRAGRQPEPYQTLVAGALPNEGPHAQERMGAVNLAFGPLQGVAATSGPMQIGKVTPPQVKPVDIPPGVARSPAAQPANRNLALAGRPQAPPPVPRNGPDAQLGAGAGNHMRQLADAANGFRLTTADMPGDRRTRFRLLADAQRRAGIQAPPRPGGPLAPLLAGGVGRGGDPEMTPEILQMVRAINDASASNQANGWFGDDARQRLAGYHAIAETKRANREALAQAKREEARMALAKAREARLGGQRADWAEWARRVGLIPPARQAP